MNCLFLGAGHSIPTRRLYPPDTENATVHWTTLDINESANPDILYDLERLEDGYLLPVGDFDEIHAYEVLEHFGSQGNMSGLFRTFKSLWKALVPGGLLIASVPAWNSVWAWGDPGHRRVINGGTLTFLAKASYDQLGKTAMSDYRALVSPCWWKIDYAEYRGDNFWFVLRRDDA